MSRSVTSAAPAPSGVLSCVLAAALGGALGAVLRWSLTSLHPVAPGRFPWVVLGINVVGSGLLAALPLLPAARRTPWVAVLLGTGVLGGFTTMSAASVDTFVLLDTGHPLLALAYAAGTLAAALAAVLVVDRVVAPPLRRRFASEGGDE